MFGENEKDADANHQAAKVPERSVLRETLDGHMVILIFEGTDQIAGYPKLMKNFPSVFTDATVEVHTGQT